jgi:hypothetical protein
MMMLNTINCGASISLPKMDGDVPLYSVADSSMDLEFMMDSEINRILSNAAQNAGYKGLHPGAIPLNCGRGQRYNCLGLKMDNRCGMYKRDCGAPK